MRSSALNFIPALNVQTARVVSHTVLTAVKKGFRFYDRG